MEKTYSLNNNNKELTLDDIIRVIIKKKWLIFSSTTFFLILSILYSFLSKPVYEASTTLKKENINERNTNELQNIILTQSSDEIDTEIEIIKTGKVLESIIEDLDLYMRIKNLEFANGSELTVDKTIFEYKKDPRYSVGPEIIEVNADFISLPEPISYYLERIDVNNFNLFTNDGQLLETSVRKGDGFLIANNYINIEFNWKNSRIGDRIYFTLNTFEILSNFLIGNIDVAKIGKTNIFQISARANSQILAKTIATTVSEKYRESRLNQKKETIRYSFNFVDKQLNEISEKLKKTELELSVFKSENKFFDITESSNKTIQFLSRLESEKVDIDLELDSYKSKLQSMQKEKEKGYFDQTYLAPGGKDFDGSPFSALLEQLSDAEIKKLELLEKRKDNHPDVLAIENQIAQLKLRLAEYNENTITSYQIIIKSLTKKQQNLDKLISEYALKIEQLPEQESSLLELMRQKNVYEKMFTMLLDKREELRMAEFSKLQDIVVVDDAMLPLKPIRPRKVFNAFIGIMIGLFIGLITAFSIDYLNKSYSGVEDIEKSFEYPILSIIPRYTKEINHQINSDKVNDHLVTLIDDEIPYKEAFRLLRTRLVKHSTNGMIKKNNVFLFTSAEANTGKTTIVANLAISLARSKKKVLLIDGDLKKAGLTSIFNVPEDFPDINTFFNEEAGLPKLYNPFKSTEYDYDISILSAGAGRIEESSELLESPKIKKFFDFIPSKFDYVIIDSPPVIELVDTLILGKYVKNTVFVIRPQHSETAAVQFAFEELIKTHTQILGLVVNATDVSSTYGKYRYGYRYGKYEY